MKGRVLVADDDSLLLQCLATFLKAENFEVQTACSAASAIAAFDKHAFDVVITDMAMETETAGYDVAKAAQAQLYRPEVIVFTSSPVPVQEWKRRGIKELFTKGQTGLETVGSTISRISNELMQRRTLLPTGTQ